MNPHRDAVHDVIRHPQDLREDVRPADKPDDAAEERRAPGIEEVLEDDGPVSEAERHERAKLCALILDHAGHRRDAHERRQQEEKQREHARYARDDVRVALEAGVADVRAAAEDIGVRRLEFVQLRLGVVELGAVLRKLLLAACELILRLGKLRRGTVERPLGRFQLRARALERLPRRFELRGGRVKLRLHLRELRPHRPRRRGRTQLLILRERFLVLGKAALILRLPVLVLAHPTLVLCKTVLILPLGAAVVAPAALKLTLRVIELLLRIVNLALRVRAQALIAQLCPLVGECLQGLLHHVGRGLVFVRINPPAVCERDVDLREIIEREAVLGQIDKRRHCAVSERGATALIVDVDGAVCHADDRIFAVGEGVDRIGGVVLRQAHRLADVALFKAPRVHDALVRLLRQTPGLQTQVIDAARERIRLEHGVRPTLPRAQEIRRVDARRGAHTGKPRERVHILLRPPEGGEQAPVEHVQLREVLVRRVEHGRPRDTQPREKADTERDDRENREIAAKARPDLAQRCFQQHTRLTTQSAQPGSHAR